MTKKYQTNYVKEHKRQQHCPCCNSYVKYNEHFPDYVCKKCIQLATDKSGRQIIFFNITNDGQGCQGKFVDVDKLIRGNICYVKGIKCFADGDQIGGIIIRVFKRNPNKKAEDISDAGQTVLK